MNRMMRAIVVERFGGPEVLESVMVPLPQPGEGEIRVRVAGAAVNPTDALFREGALVERMATTPRPYIPGMDLAGTVDALGPRASGRFVVGDPVMAIVIPTGRLGGAYADFVIVPDASTVAAPPDIGLLEASAVLMNALTARLALDVIALDVIPPRPDAILGLTGAAGIVGGFILQLASADGRRVIADAAPPDVETVLRLGAHAVVSRGDGFVREVRSLAPDGVAGLADAALVGRAVLGAVRDGGVVAALRAWAEGTERDIQVHDARVSLAADRTEVLETLRDQLAEGVLTPRIAEVLPADQAAQAHARLAAGGVRGRIVLDFQ